MGLRGGGGDMLILTNGWDWLQCMTCSTSVCWSFYAFLLKMRPVFLSMVGLEWNHLGMVGLGWNHLGIVGLGVEPPWYRGIGVEPP